MVTNPKDPLLKSGPDQQRELFDRFCQLGRGFSTEEVIGAAANVLVNALRQAHQTLPKATESFDELTAKVKALLAAHYDTLGRRRNIFPFNQTIELPHFSDRDGFKK